MRISTIAGATLLLAAGGAAAETPDALPSPGTKATAKLATPFSGTFLSKKDVDWVRAKVSKGRTYSAVIATIGDANDGGGDYLRVYDARGKLIAQNTTRGIDSKGLEFKAPYSGDVFLAVSGSQLDNGGEPYPYNILYSDDCAGKLSTTCTGQLGQGGGQWGYSDDADWRAVQLRKGQRYTLRFLNENEGGQISIRDRTGKVLGSTSLSPRTFSFTAVYGGRFFVDATNSNFDFLLRPAQYRYSLKAGG